MRYGFVLGVCLAGVLAAQSPSRESEFQRLALQLVAQRHAGAEEKEDVQKQAVEHLDGFVIEALNQPPARAGGPTEADLARVNTRLQQLIARPARVGESYRVARISDYNEQLPSPGVALVVNFGLSGPSAVRVYVPQVVSGAGAATWRPAGRIDRFSHPDYFDEYLELVPVYPASGIFVTVTGRTDDRKTGLFMAWRFHAGQLHNLWTSDLLEHSSYEAKNGELQLEFCAEPDEDKPGACRKMQRERYGWDGGWSRKAQEDVIPKTSGSGVS